MPELFSFGVLLHEDFEICDFFYVIEAIEDGATLNMNEGWSFLATAKALGAAAAEAAKAKGITKVVVDRGGNPYTGRLAVIVETAVENGLSISDKPAKEAE